MIDIKWNEFFRAYVKEREKHSLRYVITSSDRPHDPEGSPHYIPGNALDLTLRLGKDYAPIHEYNSIMKYALDNWEYRMGLDNTPMPTKPGGKGNVHIHVDLGEGSKSGRPFFFIEDNGKFVKQVRTVEDIA